jgi:hypothetical protein
MFEPVKVMLGETEYSVPTKLNFVALKRCKPHLARIGESLDLIDMAEIGVEIIAAAFADTRPEMTAENISALLLAPEAARVAAATSEIMIESGYWKAITPGEAKPAAAPAAESQTSTES